MSLYSPLVGWDEQSTIGAVVVTKKTGEGRRRREEERDGFTSQAGQLFARNHSFGIHDDCLFCTSEILRLLVSLELERRESRGQRLSRTTTGELGVVGPCTGAVMLCKLSVLRRSFRLLPRVQGLQVKGEAVEVEG
eukprot:766664-Hanusia_phi.AAC.5